jgi:S-adenosylmethionine-dependent methyltransferase
LNDISEKSLAIAKQNADKQAIQLTAVVHANALDIAQHPALKASQASFDIVLCLGPLYHLVAPDERESVIRNCIAMARPGGYVLLAYVTIYAHLRDLASREPARLEGEWEFYKGYMGKGEYTRNPETTSFHVHPAHVREELTPFGDEVRVEKIVSCEGFLGSSDVEVVMMSADSVETLNCADHLLVVLRKPL